MLAVAEMDPGISDDIVLRLASDRGSLLMTADKDFGELVFRQRRVTSGIVLMRLAGMNPIEKADVVAATVRSHADELAGAFTVITAKTVRVRRRFA